MPGRLYLSGDEYYVDLSSGQVYGSQGRIELSLTWDSLNALNYLIENRVSVPGSEEMGLSGEQFQEHWKNKGCTGSGNAHVFVSKRNSEFEKKIETGLIRTIKKGKVVWYCCNGHVVGSDRKPTYIKLAYLYNILTEKEKCIVAGRDNIFNSEMLEKGMIRAKIRFLTRRYLDGASDQALEALFCECRADRELREVIYGECLRNGTMLPEETDLDVMKKVWEGIEKGINRNFKDSFRGSEYLSYIKQLPTREKLEELEKEKSPFLRYRLDELRISLEKYIRASESSQPTAAACGYLEGRELSLERATAERGSDVLFDYITAMILAGIDDASATTEDDALEQKGARYLNALKSCIKEKLPADTPTPENLKTAFKRYIASNPPNEEVKALLEEIIESVERSLEQKLYDRRIPLLEKESHLTQKVDYALTQDERVNTEDYAKTKKLKLDDDKR